MAPVAVQRNQKTGSPATSINISATDGWTTPVVGNLIVVTANSDATVSTPSGFSIVNTVIDGNGAYMFAKVADGTESTITVAPTSSAEIAATFAEYSGLVGVTPVDMSATSTISGSGGTATTPTAVTTTVAGDLVIAAGLLHGASGAAPTSPVWTNSFVNTITVSSGSGVATKAHTFVAELVVGAPGSYSTSVSWTNTADDRQMIVGAFTAMAEGHKVIQVRPHQAAQRASRW